MSRQLTDEETTRMKALLSGLPSTFQLHVGHDILGRHYMSIKFIDGREIDIDLDKTYTIASFIAEIERKND